MRKQEKQNKIEMHKWGKVILGSNVYDMNDPEVRKDFEEYLAAKGAEYGNFTGGIMEFLKNGNDYNGNIVANTSNYAGPDEEAAIKSRNRNDIQMWWDAITNNKIQQGKNATHYVNAYRYNGKAAESPKLTDIDNRKAYFVYNTKDGTQVYALGDPKNDTIEKRFKNYLDFYENPEWVKTNRWMESLGDNEGYLKTWWDNLANDPNGQRKAAEAQITAALNEVKSKPWKDVSQETKRFLSYFNIGDPESTASSGSDTEDDDRSKLVAELKASGINPDAADFLSNFTKDKYGIWRLNPGATFDFGIPELNGKNIYFNQDFFDRYGIGNQMYEPLRGLTFYNGGIYTLNSKELSEILQRTGYNNLVRSGQFDKADNIILTRFTDANKRNPESLPKDRYSKFLSDKGAEYRFVNLTGDHKLKTRDLNDGEQIIQYINLADPSYDGPYMTYGYKFGVLGGENGDLVENINYDDIALTGNEADDFFAKGRVADKNSGAYGYIYEDPVGQNDEPSGIRIYEDPNDPENVILQLPKIRAAGVDSNKAFKLPPELAKILVETKDIWLPNVLNDETNRRNFESVLSDLVRSWFGQRNFGFDARRIFRRLGLEDAILDKAVEAWKNAKRVNTGGYRYKRRANYLTNAPVFNKNGGKMQYIAKLATGGYAGGSTKVKAAPTTKKYNVDVKNPKNAAGAFEVSEFDAADWTDLGALAADIASLGITIADPTNVAGMASGMLSSVARYRADKLRGTSGAGWNLAANLAMDTATLLPVIGDVANSASVVKHIKDALPTIIKLASLYGMGDAVINTATKIANGEKFTARDLSTIANAITAGMAIGKTGLLRKTTKTKAGELKVQNKNVVIGDGQNKVNVTLKGSDLEKVSGKKGNDAISELEKLIKSDAGVKAKLESNSITEDDITNAAKGLLKEPLLFKGKRDAKFEVKKERGQKSTETIEPNDNWLHNWFYGVGGYHEANLNAIKGQQPKSVTTVRKTIVTPDVVKIGQKQVKFSRAEQIELQNTPTMQQFEKFKQMARSKQPDLNDADLENAFRGMLRESTNRFDVVFDPAISTTTTGTTPKWYRKKSRLEKLSKVANDDGKVITRTRTYDTSAGVLNPQLILTKPDTDAQYSAFPGTYTGYETPVFYDPAQVTSRKNGGIIKAQWGLPSMPSPSIDMPIYNPYRNATVPFTFDPSSTKDYDTQRYEWLTGGNPLSAYTDLAASEVAAKHSGNANEARKSRKLWNWGKNTGPLYHLIDPILGGLQYIGVARYQNKQRDLSKKAIDAGRYQFEPVRFNQYRTDSPALQQMENKLQQQLMQNYPAVTSDPMQYYASKLARDYQLIQALSDNTMRKSDFNWTAGKENTAIGNQNISNDIQTANQNRQLNATFNSAAYNPDLVRNAERKQSFENKFLEWRNIASKQTQMLDKLRYDRAAKDAKDKYEKQISDTIGSNLWEEWQNLGSSGQAQYTDIKDWLMKKYEDSWKANNWGRQFDDLDTAYADALRNAQFDTVLLPFMRRFLGTNHEGNANPQYVKKGGYLTGSTRYTMEPDERIWVENNKATHKRVAKLSDNTINLKVSALNKK